MLDLLRGLVVMSERRRKGDLVEAPEEYPEVIVGEAGNERTWDEGRVVVPS